MNVFTHDSPASKLEERKKYIEMFNDHFFWFRESDKRGPKCDAELIKTWLAYPVYANYRGRDIYPLLCEELKKDLDVILALVKKDPEVLRLIDPKLISYDDYAIIAVKNVFGYRLDIVEPELFSDPLRYEALSKIAVEGDGINLKYVDPEFVNNYDELVKIAMDEEIKYIKLAQEEGVFNLEETKRRDLLNYIKSFKCSFIDRNILRNCKYN